MAINRNKKWEMEVTRRIAGAHCEKHLDGWYDTAIQVARYAMEIIPVGSKYVEGFATVRFLPEHNNDTPPTQIVQFEHAWCELPDGFVVDAFWSSDPRGVTHYHGLVKMIMRSNGSLLYNCFYGPTRTRYREEMGNAKELALLAFNEFDHINGEAKTWER